MVSLMILQLPANDLYDVVQFEPKVKSGVSVEAVRKIWNQRVEQAAQSQHAPALPPKSTRNTQVCTRNIADHRWCGLKKKNQLKKPFQICTTYSICTIFNLISIYYIEQ